MVGFVGDLVVGEDGDGGVDLDVGEREGGLGEVYVYEFGSFIIGLETGEGKGLVYFD